MTALDAAGNTAWMESPSVLIAAPSWRAIAVRAISRKRPTKAAAAALPWRSTKAVKSRRSEKRKPRYAASPDAVRGSSINDVPGSW
jgi:hypothetical protein